MSTFTEQAEMPKYKCHKEVWALKISDISERFVDGSALLTPEEDGYAKITVNSEYMDKHKPTVGGYFVVYSGGYQSFSPAKEFEEGYSKL